MTRTTLRMTKSTESKINYFEAKLENNPALIKMPEKGRERK